MIFLKKFFLVFIPLLFAISSVSADSERVIEPTVEDYRLTVEILEFDVKEITTLDPANEMNPLHTWYDVEAFLTLKNFSSKVILQLKDRSFFSSKNEAARYIDKVRSDFELETSVFIEKLNKGFSNHYKVVIPSSGKSHKASFIKSFFLLSLSKFKETSLPKLKEIHEIDHRGWFSGGEWEYLIHLTDGSLWSFKTKERSEIVSSKHLFSPWRKSDCILISVDEAGKVTLFNTDSRSDVHLGVELIGFNPAE